MQARLLFLGTGGDSQVMAKQHRSTGGIIFNVDNLQFHINPGPGAVVMSKMMGLNLRETTAILVTKNDILTVGGANAIISGMTHDGLDKRGILISPTDVVSSEESFITPKYKGCLEKTMSVANTNKIGISDVDIEIIEMDSSKEELCGYVFSTGKFKLGIVPDTGFFEGMGEKYEGCEILVLNILNPMNVNQKDHLNTIEAQKIIIESKCQLAILTGFGMKMLQSETLYEARELQKATNVQVIAAKDGMTINPVSFASTVRQKNLRGY